MADSMRIYPPVLDIAQCCSNTFYTPIQSTCMMTESSYGRAVTIEEERVILRETTRCKRGRIAFEAVRIHIPVRCACEYDRPTTLDTRTPPQDF